MTQSQNPRPIVALATLGANSNEESRIRELLAAFPIQVFPFDRSQKREMFWSLLRLIRRDRPRLIVQEGTGIAGGLALILGRWIWGVPYVISSGDAVGPWVGSHYRWLGPIFTAYERCLCANAIGFIGWTPYLVGRALGFGTPRGMTAAGWAPFALNEEEHATSRLLIRQTLGIPEQALVIGIAGAMVWSQRYHYCYGWELVQAIRRITRDDVHVLLVGDGTGRQLIEKLAGTQLSRRIHFTGRVPQSEVPKYLAAMDLGSLPQSVDQTGGFRYTTKISEYIAARLPMVTSQIPMSYDLDEGWLWRMPGNAPWDERYVQCLAEWLERLTPEEILAKKKAIPIDSPIFNKAHQQARCTNFIQDLLGAR